MLEVKLLCNHLRLSKIMKFKLTVMLLLLEIIGEYNKIESESTFGRKLSLQYLLILSDCFVSYKSILYKCQICLHKTGGNTFNI